MNNIADILARYITTASTPPKGVTDGIWDMIMGHMKRERLTHRPDVMDAMSEHTAHQAESVVWDCISPARTYCGYVQPYPPSYESEDSMRDFLNSSGAMVSDLYRCAFLLIRPDPHMVRPEKFFYTRDDGLADKIIERARLYTLVDSKGLSNATKKDGAQKHMIAEGIDAALHKYHDVWTVAKVDLVKFSKALREFKAGAREAKKDADWAPNQALGHLSALFRAYDLRRTSTGWWAFKDLPVQVEIAISSGPARGTKQMERQGLVLMIGGRMVSRLGEWDPKTGEVFLSEPKVKFLLAWLEATVNLFE